MDRPASARQELEIMQMLVEMSCGAAQDAQFAKLDELVRTQPQLREFVVTGLTHLADCEWENGAPASFGAVAQAGAVAPARREGREGVVAGQKSDAAVTPLTPRREMATGSSFRSWAGICASFILGAAATYWFVHQRGNHVDVVRQPGGILARGETSPATHVATLVRNTSQMWDAREGTAMEAGALLQAGQSIALFGGVAEVQFQSGVTARIQGPAILSINASGTPEIKYGKCVISNVNGDPFQFAVPAAEAFAAKYTTCGVDAFGKEVVVHTLKGQATVAPLARDAEQIIIFAGEAVRLLTTARSTLGVYKAVASPAAFDFDSLTETDGLNATSAYVDLIKTAKPVAYWRFEKLVANEVRNEMGHRHGLHLIGDQVQFVSSGENNCIEFMVRDSPTCFVSNEPLDEIAGRDYSVEFWVNPNHFHRGAIVALVEHASDKVGNVDRHGLIIELQSPSTILRAQEGRPKSLRFLHRSPPHETLVGTSCSSTHPYDVETWQHVTAVKNGASMQLFINGRLTSEASDETTLPPNLSLVIGQLFTFGTVRPFVGRLDEMAVYDRALTIDEILLRVSLLRPGTPAAD